jgi:hypothetical protein
VAVQNHNSPVMASRRGAYNDLLGIFRIHNLMRFKKLCIKIPAYKQLMFQQTLVKRNGGQYALNRKFIQCPLHSLYGFLTILSPYN